jgi:LysR family cys regulon transcriptional activator
MNEIDNLKKLARDFAASPEGTLRIATTHTQARYVLPNIVQQFVKRYPHVRLKMLEASPPQIVTLVASGQVDLGVATESLGAAAGLKTIPVYEWQHVAIVPPGHPLAKFATHPGKLSLKDLARHPVVTYEAHFAGRSRLDAAFAGAAIDPTIVLEAVDADVIKTYVRAGLGVGLIASVAADAARDGLLVLPCGHLFGRNTTRLAVKDGAYLRGFVYAFIELLAPGWDKPRLDQIFHG